MHVALNGESRVSQISFILCGAWYEKEKSLKVHKQRAKISRSSSRKLVVAGACCRHIVVDVSTSSFDDRSIILDSRFFGSWRVVWLEHCNKIKKAVIHTKRNFTPAVALCLSCIIRTQETKNRQIGCVQQNYSALRIQAHSGFFITIGVCFWKFQRRTKSKKIKSY